MLTPPEASSLTVQVELDYDDAAKVALYLICRLHDDPDNEALRRAVVKLGHALGVATGPGGLYQTMHEAGLLRLSARH